MHRVVQNVEREVPSASDAAASAHAVTQLFSAKILGENAEENIATQAE